LANPVNLSISDLQLLGAHHAAFKDVLKESRGRPMRLCLKLV
jgi:hypothetical protein